MVEEDSQPRSTAITLRGCVQGHGVRPAIARLAHQWKLAGFCENTTDGVRIAIQGPRKSVDAFISSLPTVLPTGARVDSSTVDNRVETHSFSAFEFPFCIRQGTHLNSAPLHTSVPHDRGLCHECLDELTDPSNRRFRYPLITCTNCGPRWTIISQMPYERSSTTMNGFDMCKACTAEWKNPNDRRFYSQTNSCPDCGPRVVLHFANADIEDIDEISLRCREILVQGKILSVRGIGGYQWMVDATQPAAVQSLRENKTRPSKPFAVMVHGLEEAHQFAEFNSLETKALLSPANPIVLLQRKNRNALGCVAHQNLSTIGLMLPTSAMHQNLIDATKQPLVVTSANFEGDPIEYRRPEENSRRSDHLQVPIDGFLEHERPIHRAIDDSVVRVIGEQIATIRCARGIAPLNLTLPRSLLEGTSSINCSILATGAHEKTAVALSNGSQAILGPHLGDMDSVLMRERFKEHIDDLCDIYRFRPNLIAHDLHPDYFTSCWATEQNLKTLGVQHHHAHVVSGMIQPHWLDREVLGIAWDGTGYGDDGSIWGGEFLLATTRDYRRIATLAPFPLLGGEAAIREPWRVAIALVEAACGIDTARTLRWPGIESATQNAALQFLTHQRENHTASALMTTSMGRLFDGISSLITHYPWNDFDGDAASRLESLSDMPAEETYPFPIEPIHKPHQLRYFDWRPMIQQIIADLKNDVTRARIASKVHRTLALSIATIMDQFPDHPVVLTGGCFQNKRLTEELISYLGHCSRQIATPGIIPVNDGGLAAGQLVIALANMQQSTGSR